MRPDFVKKTRYIWEGTGGGPLSPEWTKALSDDFFWERQKSLSAAIFREILGREVEHSYL